MSKAKLINITLIIAFLLLLVFVAYLYINNNDRNGELTKYATQLEQLQQDNQALEDRIAELESSIDDSSVDDSSVDAPSTNNSSNDNTLDQMDTIINPVSLDSISTDPYSLLQAFAIDIDTDTIQENIELYAQVEKIDNGEYAWDDGQKWLLLVKGEEQVYVLFDDFIQLGGLHVYLYEGNPKDKDNIHLTTILSTTAGIIIKDYTLDIKNNYFKETLIFEQSNIINYTTLKAPSF